MFLDLVRAENASFNATAESSLRLVLQCKDVDHCRTLQSIIYGCFSTIFLCTWTALHLDIRDSPLLRRLLWMMIALFVPEVMFVEAFDDWIFSSDLLAKILENYPDCGWTETHAQFVRMGGFRLVDAKEKTFIDCVKDGTIELPKVSKEDILGRSKEDLIAKIITLIQTAWFVIQCIYRRSQDLLLTELEITTLAHTLMNFFIYFFWWYKPYEVTLQIEVHFKERRSGRDHHRRELRGDSSNRNDIQVLQITEIGANTIPSISNGNARMRKSSETGLSAATKSSDDKSPAADVDKELKSDVEASNAPNGTPSTSPRHSWYTRLGIKAFSVNEPQQLSTFGRIVLNTVFFIVGGAFGAIHCLAWNSVFPTRAEQYTWQVSSFIVTVIGGTTFVCLINDLLDKEDKLGVLVFVIWVFVFIPMYFFARVSLLVLALLQLRALPYTGYAIPSWLVSYPHVG